MRYKKALTSLVLFSVFFLNISAFFSPVFAEDRANNKIGIHLAIPDENDMKKASELVNSNGGKWGYVTIVIPEDDRDKNKWQGVFDKMRELH